MNGNSSSEEVPCSCSRGNGTHQPPSGLEHTDRILSNLSAKLDNDSVPFFSLKHLHAFCVLSKVKAGEHKRRAEAVLPPPPWPLAPWLVGWDPHQIQGQLGSDVTEKKESCTDRQRNSLLKPWFWVFTGTWCWIQLWQEWVKIRRWISGKYIWQKDGEHGSALTSSLNRHGEYRCAVCGVSILLKYITSKGILLRLVGSILVELLFSPSALFFSSTHFSSSGRTSAKWDQRAGDLQHWLTPQHTLSDCQTHTNTHPCTSTSISART